MTKRHFCISATPLMYGVYSSVWSNTFFTIILVLLFVIVRLIFRAILKKTPVFDFFSKFIFFALLLIIPFSAALSSIVTYNNYYLGFIAYSLYISILFFTFYFHTKIKKTLWLLVIPVFFLILSTVVFYQLNKMANSVSNKTNNSVPTKNMGPVDFSPTLGGCGKASTF